LLEVQPILLSYFSCQSQLPLRCSWDACLNIGAFPNSFCTPTLLIVE